MGTALEAFLQKIGSGATPWKQSVRVVSVGNLSLSGLQTVDGVSLAEGDRVLLAGQTIATDNGIWAASAGSWSRSDDMSEDKFALLGLTVSVLQGSTYGATQWRMSSPTSGTVRVGATAMAFAPAASSVPETLSSLALPLVMTGRKVYTDAGTGSLVLSLATSGHQDGAELCILVPAYTRTSVVFASDLNQSGAAFNDGKDFLIVIRRVAGRCVTETFAISRPDTVSPVPLYAEVLSANADVLEVTFDESVTVADLSGITLSFTTGTPRTVSSIRSGNGTSRVAFNLSGNVGSTDVLSVVFAAGCVTDLSARAIPAQTLGVEWYSTPSEMTSLKVWYESDNQSTVSQWIDLSGNGKLAQQATASLQPSIVALGYENVPCRRYDGIDDGDTAGSGASGEFWSAATSEIWALVRPRTISDNDALPYNNGGYFGSGYVGLTFKANAGAPLAQFFNYDGTADKAEVSCAAMRPGLFHCRHTSGNLYIRRDGGAEVTGDASGNTATITGGMSVGRGSNPIRYLSQDAFALVVSDTAQTAQIRNGVKNYFRRKFGFLAPRLLLPPKIAISVGQTGRIYWDTVALAGYLAGYTFTVSGVSGTVTSSSWTWAPAAGDVGSYTMTVEMRDSSSRVVATSTTTVVVVAATATAASLRILPIGDSITAGAGGGIPKRIKSQLESAGYTVTLTGSRGGQTFAASNSAGTLLITANGHGYSANLPVDVYAETGGTLPGGLSAGTTYYVRNPATNTFELSLTSGGASIAYSSTGSGTLYVRSAVERHEGRPGWSWDDFLGTGDATSPMVFDGVFDLAQYQATYLSGAPDVVIYALGTNDFGNTTTMEDLASVSSRMDVVFATTERVIAGARAQWPNAKHLVTLLYPPSSSSAFFASDFPSGNPSQWWYQRVRWRVMQRQVAQFGGREAQGIYLVSSACLDPDNDFANAVHPLVQGNDRQGDQSSARIRSIVG